MRRRAFVAGLPLSGCAGLWRRAAPATVERPAVVVPTFVEQASPTRERPGVVRATLPGAAVVHVGVSLASGPHDDPPDRPGLTMLAFSAVLDRGLRDRLAGVGAAMQATWASDGGTMSCACEASDVAAVVREVTERMRAPTLDGPGFAAAVARAEAAEAAVLADPQGVAMRALDREVFGEPVVRARFAGLTGAALAEHAGRCVAPGRTLWISTGGDDLLPTLSAACTGWAPGTPRAPGAPPAARERGAITLVDRPGADQSVLVIGRVATAADDVDGLYTARALRILRGAVHERLRGDRGLAYHVHAGHEAAYRGGRAHLITQVDAGAVAEALKVVLWSLEHVQELQVARTWMDEQDTYDALEQVYVQDSGAGRIAAAARLHRLGWPLQARREPARSVAGLMRTIDELLRPRLWQVVCVGDRRRVQAQLERFGAVTVREAAV